MTGSMANETAFTSPCTPLRVALAHGAREKLAMTRFEFISLLVIPGRPAASCRPNPESLSSETSAWIRCNTP